MSLHSHQMKKDLLKVKGCSRHVGGIKANGQSYRDKDKGQHHRHLDVSTGAH